MWHLTLVAAAAAGTWFHSKHLRHLFDKRITPHPCSDSLPRHEVDPQQQHSHDPEESKTQLLISPPDVSPPHIRTVFGEINTHQNDGRQSSEDGDGVAEEGLFKFSSLSSCETQNGVGTVSTDLRKKVRFGVNRSKSRSALNSKKSVTKIKQRQQKPPVEENPGFSDVFCSKSSFSADGSFFHWGLGAGIMFMASAAKAETNKLNAALDETAELVHELKTELRTRRALRDVQQASIFCTNAACTERTSVDTQKPPKTPIKFSDPDDPHSVSFLAPRPGDDGDCASSDVTEDRLQQSLEMNELEAELESELEKIPWSISQHERRNSDLSELPEHVKAEAVNGEISGTVELNRHHGSKEGAVSSVELEQKLHHLLIQQQERQIIELQTQLHSTRDTLRTTRTQLQSLKNHVRRRLTEFSLQTASDGEDGHKENIEEQEDNGGAANSESFPLDVGPTIKMPFVGTKRALEIGSCHHCHVGDGVSGFS